MKVTIMIQPTILTIGIAPLKPIRYRVLRSASTLRTKEVNRIRKNPVSNVTKDQKILYPETNSEIFGAFDVSVDSVGISIDGSIGSAAATESMTIAADELSNDWTVVSIGSCAVVAVRKESNAANKQRPINPVFNINRVGFWF